AHHLPRPQDLPPGVEPPRPISVTFIPATVFDNSALLQVNPEYLGSLLSLPTLERERLLGGNWKIRPAAGLYFKREWEIDRFLEHALCGRDGLTGFTLECRIAGEEAD